MSDQNNTAKSSHAWGSAERVAIITGGFVVLTTLITSMVSLYKADSAQGNSEAAKTVAVEAKVEATKAVNLATGESQCRDGSEFPQKFLDRPIGVDGAGGEIDLNILEASVRFIPKEVPEDAKFVQLLATVTTGNAQESGEDRFLKVSSKSEDSSNDCSFYVYFRTFEGSFFAYTSSSTWLPIAPGRKISAALLSFDGTPANPLPGNASATARLFVTGYR